MGKVLHQEKSGATTGDSSQKQWTTGSAKTLMSHIEAYCYGDGSVEGRLVNNKAHLYPQNSTLGLLVIERHESLPDDESYSLFHEHPSKRISKRVGLIMDLVGSSGQVGFGTGHLGE
jgi:hypothetical protein